MTIVSVPRGNDAKWSITFKDELALAVALSSASLLDLQAELVGKLTVSLSATVGVVDVFLSGISALPEGDYRFRVVALTTTGVNRGSPLQHFKVI